MSTGLKNAVLFNQPMISALSFGVIQIYTGAQPASPNDAPTGTLLGTVTRDGLSWTEGNPQGGLTLTAIPSFSYLVKSDTQTWIFTAVDAGQAGWWRFRSNSDAAVSMDGSITAPFQELYIGSPTIGTGDTREIEAFQIGFQY